MTFKAKLDKKDQIDMLFLHASPNLYKQLLQQDQRSADGKKHQKMKLPALDFRKEKKTIKNALTQSGKKIRF